MQKSSASRKLQQGRYTFMHFLLWIRAGTQITTFICRSIKFISVIWTFKKNICFLSCSKHRYLDIFKCFVTVFLKFTKHSFRRFKKHWIWALELVPLKSIRVLHIYLNNFHTDYRFWYQLIAEWQTKHKQQQDLYSLLWIRCYIHSAQHLILSVTIIACKHHISEQPPSTQG